MIKSNILVLCLFFAFNSNMYAGGTDCGSGECPVLERAKDVGDAALKDLVPYIGLALVIGLASSDGMGNGFYGEVDKNPYQNGIQIVDESFKYSVDILSLSNSFSYDPLEKNTFSFNLLEVKYKLN